ncbi:hypothetical protein PF007_g3760 [Phytophthora fragariae]|uniref:Uncharacterized protein n=1 Tax=Phytophthora fragariae TaxID=53985 RepID=A0A6A3FM48_9STRA|nr:hypothetical protein PF003_g24809 [Phytophthora fragariae]KAE8945401.1 hypothetical protein PF009_g4934 [Phytophthora fragariae]KAE9132356.1 hypothetical protein PF007_g3760 [Phytophthora fragariae]
MALCRSNNVVECGAAQQAAVWRAPRQSPNKTAGRKDDSAAQSKSHPAPLSPQGKASRIPSQPSLHAADLGRQTLTRRAYSVL